MGIKFIHEHPEKNGVKCFVIKSRDWPLTKPHMIEINGKQFAAAYNPYSWHWYIFNPETGREVGSMSRELFEAFEGFTVAGAKVSTVYVSPMEIDEECKP